MTDIIREPFGTDPDTQTPKTAVDVGAVSTASGITVVEQGDAVNHKTVLTLAGFAVGSATGAANLAFGALMYTLPAGAQVTDMSYMNLALTGTTTIVADTPEVGIGSVLGAGVQATLGAAGATMEDYWEGTSSGAIDGTNAVVGTKGATAGILTGIALNASGDVKTLYLNVAYGWAGTGDVTAIGTVTITWKMIS